MNVAYRWFLGYGLNEATPHFSTLSYNFRNRFNSETVDKIFNWILEEIANEGYLSTEAVFIDGTHIKANANTKKKIQEEVPVAAKRYAKELLEEINNLGIGPQGFGGKTTALAVNIEKFPTHIAGLPVAVNINCHVTRHSTEVI